MAGDDGRRPRREHLFVHESAGVSIRAMTRDAIVVGGSHARVICA
jgi:hypothetical protein